MIAIKDNEEHKKAIQEQAILPMVAKVIARDCFVATKGDRERGKYLDFDHLHAIGKALLRKKKRLEHQLWQRYQRLCRALGLKQLCFKKEESLGEEEIGHKILGMGQQKQAQKQQPVIPAVLWPYLLETTIEQESCFSDCCPTFVYGFLTAAMAENSPLMMVQKQQPLRTKSIHMQSRVGNTTITRRAQKAHSQV